MYSIEIENLTKKFKEKTAVNNVSLKTPKKYDNPKIIKFLGSSPIIRCKP